MLKVFQEGLFGPRSLLLLLKDSVLRGFASLCLAKQSETQDEVNYEGELGCSDFCERCTCDTAMLVLQDGTDSRSVLTRRRVGNHHIQSRCRSTAGQTGVHRCRLHITERTELYKIL